MARKVFALVVAAMFFYIASPLLFPVAMGAVIAVLFYPWLERLERRGIKPGLAASCMTLGITLLLLIPTSMLVFVGAKTGLQELQSLKDAPSHSTSWVESFTTLPGVTSLLHWITSWFPIQMQELVDTTQDFLRSLGNRAGDLLGLFLTHLPGMVMAVAVIVVSVFFFLVDGRQLVDFLRRHSIFDPAETDHLIRGISSMCRSVILASIVSGAVQAVTEGIAVAGTQTPNAALITVLVFMASFIPVIGSAPVTFSVAVQQFLSGRPRVGIILVIAAIVVAVLDNLIRPMFLRGSANLHPMIAFVAAFGGLQMLGFVGVFLGPIIAGLFIITFKLMAHEPQT